RNRATVAISACVAVKSEAARLETALSGAVSLASNADVIYPFSTNIKMSYQVIARKWRPQLFEDVTGQEHVTQTLRNAIEHGRLHHAYLLSGARGVGKTT